MAHYISAVYSNTWAHESPTEHPTTDAGYTITGTITVTDGPNGTGTKIPGKVLRMSIPSSMVSIQENGKWIERDSVNEPYLLHGDGQGSYTIYIVAADKTIANVHYVVDGEPDTSATNLPRLLTFTSTNNPSTTYGMPKLPVDDTGHIAVDVDEITVKMDDSYKEFDNQNAEIALLINDTYCVAMDFDLAYQEGFKVPVVWLKEDDTNLFSFTVVSVINSVTSPIAPAKLAGEIIIMPQVDKRRTLQSRPYLERHFTYINAADLAGPVTVYLDLPKGNPDKFAAGDTIDVLVYINGYNPIDYAPKNHKLALKAKTVLAADIADTANEDVTFTFDIDPIDLTGYGPSAPKNPQPGYFYIDYTVTKKGAADADRMPTKWMGGRINTVNNL